MTSFTDLKEYPFDMCVDKYTDMDLLQFSSLENSEKDVNFQYWMKSGLVWYYAFNHEESIECFKRALEVSENTSAMAHWGISICHGTLLHIRADYIVSLWVFISENSSHFHDI